MQKNYILNNFQTATITNAIRYEGARIKAMSILAYLTRLQTYGTIEKTYKDLYRMHQKSSNRVRVSFPRFKAIMKQLIDLGLISTDDKTKNSIHTYIVILGQSDKKSKNQSNKKSDETTENKEFSDSDVSNSNQIKNNNKYNNNFTSRSNNFGKTLSFEEGQILVENLLKSMRVKSEFVKQLAFLKIGKIFNKINIAGSEAYIIKVIQDLINENRIKFLQRKKELGYRYNQFASKNTDKIKLFREKNYDYNALECELLGWDED